MMQEFKDFINKGNVVGFAVAVIMAGAFGAVVTSFTGDILMPPIGLALGDVDFSSIEQVLQEEQKNADGSVSVAKVAIGWGKFIKFIIDFLIIAFILFFVVKAWNRANPPAPEPEAGPSQEDLLSEIRDLLKK